jgi:hypothetical protein
VARINNDLPPHPAAARLVLEHLPTQCVAAWKTSRR